jgi:hypothetical protein
MVKRPFLRFIKQKLSFEFSSVNVSSIKYNGIAFSGSWTDGRTDGAVFIVSTVGCLNGDLNYL